MTAVGLLATVAGAGSGEADTGGRASADSGSLFGDALTAAGRMLDGATDSGTAMPATARQSGPAAEASAVPDRTIDPQAAIAAMTHLVAWSAPVTAESSATTPQVMTPQTTTSETAIPQVTAPQATTSETGIPQEAAPQATSETTLPGEMAPDATVETMPGEAGAEATPVDPASGGTGPDAVATVPSDTVPATQTTSASATSTSTAATPASAPASSPASAPAAAAVADGRGEPQTLQRRPTGDVREVGIKATATPQEPASGGVDPLTSDPVAAVLRPEPLPRQSPPAIPSMVGVPVPAPAPGAGGSIEQQMASDAGDQPQGSQPATASVAPVAPSVPTVPPVSSPDAATTANRAVAAQVAPVVVSIAQRPMGTHQLTMTVNPDSLGPVTVRAHITASGEVRVELSGATDVGRDALRTMLVELRRDLAAVMPHATLSVNHGTSADASGDRGQQAAGDAPTQQGAGDRDANRGRPDHRRGVEQAPDLPRTIQTTPSATSGAGLDIFA